MNNNNHDVIKVSNHAKSKGKKNKEEEQLNVVPVSNDNHNEMLETLSNEDYFEKVIKRNVTQIEDKFKDQILAEQDGIIQHDDPEYMKQLYYDLQMKHPRTVKNGKPKKYSWCSSTGWFWGCGDCKASALTELGIGVVIYFKFIKSLIICFLLATIINIPIIYVYTSNQKENKSKNYMDTLFKTTIGNVGSTLYNCEANPISILQDTSFQVTMTCNGGKIPSKVIAFGTSEDLDSQDENQQNCIQNSHTDNLHISSGCDLKDAINEVAAANCDTQSSCSFTIDWTSLPCSARQSTLLTTVFLSYGCYGDNVDYGEEKAALARTRLSYMAVFTDIASLFIIMITWIIISKHKNKNFKHFIEENIFIRDFTLKLKGIDIPKERVHDEINNWIKHFSDLVYAEDPDLVLTEFQNADLTGIKGIDKDSIVGDYKEYMDRNFWHKDWLVVDVTYPILNSEKLGAIKKYNKLQRKYNRQSKSKIAKTGEVIMPVMAPNAQVSEENNNDNGPESRVNEVATHRIANPEQDNEQSPEAVELLNKIKSWEENIKQNVDVKEVNEMYITFRNYNIARFFETRYRKNKCRRCGIIMCCKYNEIKRFYFNGKWLSLSFVQDEPTNIKWENITFPACKHCCRSCFSFTTAFIIILFSLALMIVAKYYESQLNKTYNTDIDCTFVDTSDISKVQAEFTNSAWSNHEKVLSYCFCYNRIGLQNVLNSEIKDFTFPGTTIKPCEEYMTSYIIYTGLLIGLIVLIPVINTIAISMLRFLTNFERNKTWSEDMVGNMWKMFLIQFFNTGWLLIWVNLKIDSLRDLIPNFPLFAGVFSDMNPKWFNNVGVVILFSMILGIFTPHLASMCFILWNYCFRCIDSGCSCGRRTKRKTRKAYFKWYVGTDFLIDARYSSILSSFYVTMIFCSGIPILYAVFFLFWLITFLTDKYLILRFNRLPPKYNIGIQSLFEIYAFFGIWLHFGFAIWIYGNPTLLIDYTLTRHQVLYDFVKGNYDDSINKWYRVILPHNIWLFIIWVILILTLVIRVFFIDLIPMICCKAKKEKQISKDMNIELGAAVKLKDLYKTYQVKQIQYYKILKSMENNTEWLDNWRKVIMYLKKFMMFKWQIFGVWGHESEKSVNDFDNRIAKDPSVWNIESKGIIAGDTSYDLVFNQEFDNYAYYEYIKNI